MTQADREHTNIELIIDDKPCLAVNYSFHDTLFGEVLMASCENGICALYFAFNREYAMKRLQRQCAQAVLCHKVDHWQEAALRCIGIGKLNSCGLKLHVKGTDFQLAVWRALLDIPFGETRTYGEIAHSINRNKAVRAVGTAVGNNPISLLIPCHRVIRSGGDVGEYHWGRTCKQQILNFEHEIIMNNTIRIRPSMESDIHRMLEIFELAKGIMRSDGNMKQWTGGYPSVELLKKDIHGGHSFICEDRDGNIVGTFAFILGDDPTYAKIYEGAWLDDEKPYGVIHRIASSPHCKGIASACLEWCSERTDNIRVDTHRDNSIMQHIMQKHGFTYCGIIYLANGDERLAYQRIRQN